MDLSFRQVFIVSHRRSGTHMLVNLVRYNFRQTIVWKTNHMSCSNCALLTNLRDCGGIILHAYRNLPDVAVSLHKYHQTFTEPLALDEFISQHSVGKNWSAFTQNCFSIPAVTHFPFEMVRTQPNSALRLLSELFDESHRVNVSSIPHNGAVAFSGGQLGSWNALSGMTVKNLVSHWSASWRSVNCECDNKTNATAEDGHECLPQPWLFDRYYSQ